MRLTTALTLVRKPPAVAGIEGHEPDGRSRLGELVEDCAELWVLAAQLLAGGTCDVARVQADPALRHREGEPDIGDAKCPCGCRCSGCGGAGQGNRQYESEREAAHPCSIDRLASKRESGAGSASPGVPHAAAVEVAQPLHLLRVGPVPGQGRASRGSPAASETPGAQGRRPAGDPSALDRPTHGGRGSTRAPTPRR